MEDRLDNSGGRGLDTMSGVLPYLDVGVFIVVFFFSCGCVCPRVCLCFWGRVCAYVCVCFGQGGLCLRVCATVFSCLFHGFSPL